MVECISTLEKVRRDMDDNIYNFTKDGECTGCGSCCSNLLPMNGKEIKEIRRYIRKHDIKECRRMFPAVKQPLDMTCPFLDISKGKISAEFIRYGRLCAENLYVTTNSGQR